MVPEAAEPKPEEETNQEEERKEVREGTTGKEEGKSQGDESEEAVVVDGREEDEKGEAGGNDTISKYRLGETIGEGKFGLVKRAEIVQTGEDVAIKILDRAMLDAQQLNKQIKDEIRMMLRVNHPNVVRNVWFLSNLCR